MKTVLLIALFAAIVADDPPQQDIDKIQGDWVVSRMEFNGKPQPKNRAFPVTVTFDGDKLLARVGKGKPDDPKGSFKLDQNQKPKFYDVTTREGMKVLGIYELDGDTLKVCLSSPGDERPTTLATTPDDNRTVISYERVKASKGK